MEPDEAAPSDWSESGSWVPPVLDALSLALDADMLVCVRFAEKLTRVDQFRRGAIQDAAAHGRGADIAVRSARLELAWTHLYAPAVEAHAAFDRATAMAKSIQKAEHRVGIDDPRTFEQVRADVYGDLLVAGTVKAHPRAARRIRAQIVVTVPALSLLDDEHAKAAEPAVVEGVGPIPIEKAREYAAEAKDWIRVLTHPETGMVLSIGRDRYKVPKAMRQAVIWRSSRCLTPGCGMLASRCELDHRVEWHEGGETKVTNLNPLCKNHHILKTVTDWHVEQADSGGTIWTSPTGRTYTVEPERRLPAFTVPPSDQPPPF